MEELGITHVAESKAAVLSGGERRRLEITRALATEPAFMLLDEPFAGIDPLAVIDIKKIIAHLKRPEDWHSDLRSQCPGNLGRV